MTTGLLSLYSTSKKMKFDLYRSFIVLLCHLVRTAATGGIIKKKEKKKSTDEYNIFDSVVA